MVCWLTGKKSIDVHYISLLIKEFLDDVKILYFLTVKNCDGGRESTGLRVKLGILWSNVVNAV